MGQGGVHFSSPTPLEVGYLQYRRVAPKNLRPVVDKGTITATLSLKVLHHAALISCIEIDRDGQRRMDHARRKREGQIAGDGVSPPEAVFIDIRKYVAAFSAWKDREIGWQSVRLYGFAGGDDDRVLLASFKYGIDVVGNGSSAMMKMNAVPDFDLQLVEALGIVGMSV